MIQDSSEAFLMEFVGGPLDGDEVETTMEAVKLPFWVRPAPPRPSQLERYHELMDDIPVPGDAECAERLEAILELSPPFTPRAQPDPPPDSIGCYLAREMVLRQGPRRPLYVMAWHARVSMLEE